MLLFSNGARFSSSSDFCSSRCSCGLLVRTSACRIRTSGIHEREADCHRLMVLAVSVLRVEALPREPCRQSVDGGGRQTIRAGTAGWRRPPLREQFENAVATLKQKHRGGHSLYELPWYVIIGAPARENNSARQFRPAFSDRTADRQGRAARRGRHEELRLVVHRRGDLPRQAGRYTTQDSDAAPTARDGRSSWRCSASTVVDAR